MIFKSDLVDAINDLSQDLIALSLKMKDLDERVVSVEKNACNCKKALANKPRRATKAKEQPRDKSGKFMKK